MKKVNNDKETGGQSDRGTRSRTKILEEDYSPSKIEAKWAIIWETKRVYQPDLNSSQKPYYNLMMFPYPSAEGLHVGNMYAFCGSDIFGRFKRMQGFDVFEPIGLDGFGIHSENYAMKIGEHPVDVAKRTKENFYRQLHLVGNSFDWSHTLETFDRDYYSWTQWIFVQFFKNGLAYRKQGEVNWCPSCLTVLSDEQVIKMSNVKRQTSNVNQDVDTCERCGTEVIRKELTQWYFKITDYAQRLLESLDEIDWSDKIKTIQRNWLGKSQGTEIVFDIDIDKIYSVPIFTTRADTLFGVTFLALAIDHPLVITILDQAKGPVKQSIREFLDYSSKRQTSNDKRQTQIEREGVFSGFFAKNPINGESIPVYVADYVLTGYGTGAVMGVPAHDQRDFEFAMKHKIEIKQVIKPTTSDDDISRAAFTSHGELVNSGKYSGRKFEEAILKITEDLEKSGCGTAKVNWHLRDWVISRQRYWGPPIPMIFCESCAKEGKSWFTQEAGPVGKNALALGQSLSRDQRSEVSLHKARVSQNSEIAPSRITSSRIKEASSRATQIRDSLNWNHFGWYPVPEKDLPVELPYIENFKPTGKGISPLAQDEGFVNVKCPGCGARAKRETDVSDTFLDSSWYFLRYLSIDNAGPVSSFPPTNARSKQKTNVEQKDNVELRVGGNPSRTATRNSENMPWDPEVTKRWLPVDMYLGGAEHAVLHLMYARFVTKFFYDLGLIDFDEPFSKFRAHGLLIKDGAKMSKSKGNVVNPDDYIKKFGADTLRTYLMFCGRYSEGGDFRDEGIEGMHRFLKRVWKLVQANLGPVSGFPPASARSSKKSIFSQKNNVELRAVVGPSTTATQGNVNNSNLKLDRQSLFMVHKTIKKVTGDIENLSYNTAIAALMEWVNFLEKKIVNSSQLTVHSKKMTVNRQPITRDEVKTLLLLLAPFAPHMTEELWQLVHSSQLTVHSNEQTVNREPKAKRTVNWSIHLEKWPEYDEKLATSEKVNLIIQVNGRVRDKLETVRGMSKEDAQALALASEKVSKYVSATQDFKVIYVVDKLINFVVSGKN